MDDRPSRSHLPQRAPPPMAESDREEPLLATIPPTMGQRRTVRIFMLALVASVLVTWPFGAIKLSALHSFVPTLAAALFITYVVTAVLLFGQFSLLRQQALLVIANGYVFSGLMVVAHALAFPGAFSPTGLNGAGLQSGVLLYSFWHLGLPFATIGYALLKDTDRTISAASTRIAISTSVAAMVVLAGAIFWFLTRYHELLPVSYVDVGPLSLFRSKVGGVVDTAITGAALYVLWVRRRTLLDEWLLVALFAIVTELLLAAILTGDRFTVAWYAARLYQVVTAAVVMIVLLSETATLYANIARSNTLLQRERLLLKEAEETARENERRYQQVQMEVAHANRVATMGQLSTSIAHEVNQPIAGVVTNAHVASRRLNATPPNIEEAQQALARIVRDGNRASDIIERVRALSRKTAPQKSNLDINEAILEVVALARGEATKNGISVETRLADDLPSVDGDRVQLQQVVLNLIMNAFEAMSAGHNNARHLSISAARTEPDRVVVAVQDSGPGVDSANLDQIFHAFYTTKPDGVGVGLSICRAIIEAHGGRLWASNGVPQGAVFQFTLPTRSESTS
jgi:signal transduction histidine kinase